jgi:uncharacterized protein (UPF0261 family)
MPVVVIATLDTKGHEAAFARDRLREWGLEALLLDAGSLGPPAVGADIPRGRVFAAEAGEAVPALGRGEAVARAAAGAVEVVLELERAGRLEGVLGLGGSAGTTIGTAAMRALPFGRPKVMLSTLASGQTRPFVGGSDIVLMHSVADLAGLNRLTRTVIAGAADALAGMVLGRRDRPPAGDSGRPIVAATMFGVTTPCVDRARQALERAGCEVLVFHATGVGGRAMEGLVRDGQVAAVLDLTTTELADEHVGGILSAGPDRLTAAAGAGVPQVVSVGALDMVNFGPRETVPERFAGRRLHVHNANVTLMRTTPEECAAIGRRMAEALAGSRGPTVVLLPRGGVSALDVPGGPFHDPEADAALFEALRGGLAGAPGVRVVERPEAINDPSFADAAAGLLLGLLAPRGPGGPPATGAGGVSKAADIF